MIGFSRHITRTSVALIVVIVFIGASLLTQIDAPKVRAYSQAWPKAIKITIDHTKVATDLTNFPVYVNLASLGSSFFSSARSDCGDIRVTTGPGTEVPREVVSCDTSAKTGELYFKAPTLSSSTDTAFYMYYGNGTAANYASTDTYGRNNVWTSYKSVLHFSEKTGNFTDSTGSGNDGTQIGTLTRNSGGLLGDYVSMTTGAQNTVDIPSLNVSGDATISVISKLDSTTQDNNGSLIFGSKFRYYTTGSASFKWRAYGSSIADLGSPNNWGDLNWHFASLRASPGNGIYSYFDGAPTVSSTATDSLTASTATYRVGGSVYATQNTNSSITEVRVSDQDLGAGWLATQYANFTSPSTFYASALAGLANDPAWQDSLKITIDHTKISSNLTNFPVYVNMADLGTGFFSGVRSDCGDIRMTTEAGAEIPREVASCDTSAKTGELYFLAPNLSSTVDTVFYLYYKNPTAADYVPSATYGAQNVWTNGYAAVYHLDEDPTPPTNLLTNPGAEDSMTGWTLETGAITTTISAYGLDPYAGSSYFTGKSGADNIAYQDVDLLATGYSQSQLNSGVKFALSAQQGNNYPDDTGQVILQFMDGSGNVLSTTASPLKEITPEDTWEHEQISAITPTGTQTARVKLRAKLVAGSNANTSFDSLFLNESDVHRGVITDSTANGNNAVSSPEMTVADSVVGKLGHAISFSGGSLLNVNNSPSLNFGTGNVTISAWLYPNSVSTPKQALVDNGDGSNSGLRLMTDDSDGAKLKLIRGSQFADGTTSNSILANSTWSNIIATTSGNTVQFYNNGASAGSGTLKFTSFSNASLLRIGHKGYAASSVNDLNAELDELRLSSVNRSADWVSTQYNDQSDPATFYSVEPVLSGSLTVDIVDASGTSVASPALSMTPVSTSFGCVSSVGTLGTSSQRIRLSNTTSSPSWSLSFAATDGASALWSSGSALYDYNDPTGAPAGCSPGTDSDTYAGLLSLNFSSASITPQDSCSNTGVSLGTDANFNEGITDALTLMSASGSASTNCYWDLTGVGLNQQIPAGQPPGNYSLNLTLTVVAN